MTKNVFSFSRYAVDIVDGRIYKYACYALTQREALEAASAVHVAARGALHLLLKPRSRARATRAIAPLGIIAL